MAANQKPIFILTPFFVCAAPAANTQINGTGDFMPLLTAGANGALVTRIGGKARETTAATDMIRFFLDMTGAGDKFLWEELAVTAVTFSATVKAWEEYYTLPEPLPMPANSKIWVTKHSTASVTAMAFGGHY
jgi:hypothetical protein